MKLSRIIKRRQVAKRFCDAGKVQINQKFAKPSDTVKVGDELRICFGSNIVNFKVLDINEHVRKEDALKMYEEIVL